MKYILFRAQSGLDNTIRKHELVAVEDGEDIDTVTPFLIQAVREDLAELPEYRDCETAAYAPEPIASARRVKRYQYEIRGIVYPRAGLNILYDYGVMEKTE